jgi:hypothetical protein
MCVKCYAAWTWRRSFPDSTQTENNKPQYQPALLWHKGKVKMNRSLRLQKMRLTDFLDSQHMKAIRLSALHSGRLYHPQDTLGTHFVGGWIDSRVIVWPED